MLEIQALPRAVNELLILTVLRDGPMHGYQIALEIEERSGGYFGFNHGTLYPILHSLEKEGLIDGAWDEGRGPRRRKEYRLTGPGRSYLEERAERWREFREHLSALVPAGPALRSRAASDSR
jgi:PadR family transcriptional regulator, regulatory protein PadR